MPHETLRASPRPGPRFLYRAHMLKTLGFEKGTAPPVRQEHPHPSQLESFLRGELPRVEARPVVRHLLASCAQCLSVTRRLWALGGGGR